jgi:hypothetical protein
VGAGGLLFLLLSAPAALTAAPPSAAAQVGALRTEIDGLAHRVEAERRRAQDTLAALRAERAELQRQLRLAEVRAQTIARVEADHRARADGLEGDSEARLAPLRRAVHAAEAYVQSTLPFKTGARLEQLSLIRRDLAALHPDPGLALSRLWRFVEEEEALAREVGRTQQPIELDGARQLVDVARIGMALLYFRTASGKLGWARLDGAGWRFERVTTDTGRGAIAAVFEAFDHNRTFGPQSLLLPKSKL